MMNPPQRKFALESLTVKDFRCFKSARVDFNRLPRQICIDQEAGETTTVEPLTVFLAKNGMGKTAIIDAIRILFGTYTLAFPSKSKVIADQESIRLFRDADGRLVQAQGLAVSGKILLRGESFDVSRELTSDEGARTSVRNVRAINDYATQLSNKSGPETEYPILAYYGTGRLWAQKQERRKARILLKKRDYGYKDCLSALHSFKAVNQWLTQAVDKKRIDERDVLVQDQTINAQVCAVSRAVDQVLRREGYSAEFTIDVFTHSLAIRKSMGDFAIPMPISQLSDGVKAAMGMFSDIAYRCSMLNPQFGERAAEKTSGIVLIDEIDLHLHPSWQQTILNALQLAFPRIQFIVTTHSPQVVSSVPSECVRVIDGNEISQISLKTEGAKSSQILEDVFGVPSRVSSAVSRVSRDLEEYRRLVASDRWDSDEAKHLKLVLDDVLASDPELSVLDTEVKLRDYNRRHEREANR